jgi:putative transposase
MSAGKTYFHVENSGTEPASRRAVPGSTPVPGVGESVPLSRTCESEEVYYSKRRLPHFEKPWTTYAITMSTRSHRVLSPDSRTIVLNAFLHFHRCRYELFAACVMPDHTHLLLQPWPKDNNLEGNATFWGLSEIAHSLKSFTAHRINKLEGITGPLWEEEVFDRYIRSESDLVEKFRYICRNPWQARIADPSKDYPWLWTWQNDVPLGITPVPGVGETVPVSQPSHQSSFRRDAETHARDGRAPQNRSSTR